MVGPALRAVLVLLLLATTLLAPTQLALAGPAAASPVAGTAFLRLAHLSPDTPPVDIAVVAVSDPARRLDVPGVAYGAVSEYAVLEPGSYTVSMRAAGAPADSPPVITTTFTAGAGEAVTVAGLGDHAELALQVLRDDLSPPPAGQARVRIINAAPGLPSLDVRLADGLVVAAALPYASTSEYRTVPIGAWDVIVGRPGAFGTQLAVTLDANTVYSVLLVTRDGGLEAEIRVDGAGTPAMPKGSIAAGYGGAAGSGLPAFLPLLAVPVLGLPVLAVVLRARAARRRG